MKKKSLGFSSNKVRRSSFDGSIITHFFSGNKDGKSQSFVVFLCVLLKKTRFSRQLGHRVPQEQGRKAEPPDLGVRQVLVQKPADAEREQVGRQGVEHLSLIHI